jgi:hypothetical protein
MDENKWHNRIMHLTSFSLGIVVTALMMAKGMFELMLYVLIGSLVVLLVSFAYNYIRGIDYMTICKKITLTIKERTYSRKKIIRGREINNSDMWGRNNNPDEYGGLNKADIAYAVRKFLNDAHDYAEHDEYMEIKRVMTTFMEYVEEL